MVQCNSAVAGASPDVVLVAALPPDASRHKEQVMAVDRIDRPITRVTLTGRAGKTPRTDARRDTGTGPLTTLLRSLLLLVLAAIAILALLPAVVAAQSAATL